VRSDRKRRPTRGETSDPLLSGQVRRKQNRDAEAEWHVQLGVTYRQRGDLEEAIGAFQGAVRVHPHCASARYHLGMAYGLQGRVYEAVHELSVAQRLGSLLAAQVLGKARRRPGAFQERGKGLVIARPDNVAELLALAQPPQRVWWEKAGLELCLVSKGEFVRGSPEGRGRPSEHPQHRIYLDPYYIGRYPVTQAQYARFVRETGHRVPHIEKDWAQPHNWNRQRQTPPQGREEHPVVLISWDDAVAYCEWAGLRLPTEAEWEKAARGADGREYPWGDQDPTETLCNFGALGGTTPVGQYSPQGDSPCACADMAGNVWEWVNDWYQEDYYRRSPSQNPMGPSSGRFRVLRGGSCIWAANHVRSANRYRSWNYPDDTRVHGGFRCARGAEPETQSHAALGNTEQRRPRESESTDQEGSSTRIIETQGEIHEDASLIILEQLEEFLTDGEYDYRLPKRGDIHEGVVIEIGERGAIVDAGFRRDGIVPVSDLDRLNSETLENIKLGEGIAVAVQNPQDEEGRLILSIYQALVQEDWDKAEAMMARGELYEGEISGYNRGGLLVAFGTIRGFIPASHIVGVSRGLQAHERGERLAARVGEKVSLRIIEVDRHRRRLILSQRLARRA